MLQRTLLRLILTPALLASLGMPKTQDHIAQDKEKFARETDATHKVKDFDRLAAEQITDFGHQVDINNIDAAFQDLSDYQKEAHQTYDALKASGASAEHKPESYRRLQIHLQRDGWEINRVLPAIPDDRRTEFRAIRDDLDALQNRLIHDLFPSASDFRELESRG
jgi:hypothetical protein